MGDCKAFVLGMNTKLYYSTTSADCDWDQPNWQEICLVKDVNLNQSLATADASTRCGNGWRQTVGTLAEGSLTTQMLYDPNDPTFLDLQGFYENRQAVQIAFSDGPIGDPASWDPTYMEATFMITDFSVNQGLEDVVLIDITMQTTPGLNPTWRNPGDSSS